MSKYFTENEIEYIVNRLMDPHLNYEPLAEPLLEYDTMGKVLDNLVDKVINDIKNEPVDALYHHHDRRNLAYRFDDAEDEVI